MAFRSLPGDDPPTGGECKSLIDTLLGLGGPSGLYGYFDRCQFLGKAGVGLSLVLSKAFKVSEMYTTADVLRTCCARVDLATSRRQATHVAYLADSSLKLGTTVASKGLPEAASLQSMYGQYSLERNQGANPNPLESKAAIISAWNGILVHVPLGQPTTIDFSYAWTGVLLSAINFLEAMHAMQEQQMPVVWTGNLATLNVLGSRRNALAFGHQLAAGLLAGTQIVLELSSAEWARVGWVMRMLFSGAPSVITQWMHNNVGDITIPAPQDNWQQGLGPATGAYRAFHSCFQVVTPPEIFVFLTDDGGQVPADTSMLGLLNRGNPAIFIPNQRFIRLGGEIEILYEALQIPVTIVIQHSNTTFILRLSSYQQITSFWLSQYPACRIFSNDFFPCEFQFCGKALHQAQHSYLQAVVIAYATPQEDSRKSFCPTKMETVDLQSTGAQSVAEEVVFVSSWILDFFRHFLEKMTPEKLFLETSRRILGHHLFRPPLELLSEACQLCHLHHINELLTQSYNIPLLLYLSTSTLSIHLSTVRCDINLVLPVTLLDFDILSAISFDILAGISSDMSSDILSDISFIILSDISSDILSDISFDILPGVSSDMSSDILSDISFDILSDISFDILSDMSSDILSDISFDILSDISFDRLSGNSSAITFDILSDISFDILSDISCDIVSGISSDILSDRSFDILSDILSDISF